MSGEIKSISNPTLRLEILSPQAVEQLHSATLDIIAEVGVRFPSEQALDIWEEHGAQVDRTSQIVKASGALIEEALQKAPPAYTLAAAQSGPGSAVGWQPRIHRHGWVRGGDYRHSFPRTPPLLPAGCGGDCRGWPML